MNTLSDAHVRVLAEIEIAKKALDRAENCFKEGNNREALIDVKLAGIFVEKVVNTLDSE